ncbi:MAG: beta-ketoacyl-ACP synthase II [Oscillospiraceae bacterium]|nr:beta-ketoacyl-ACP synthase II [Oscillospiraceae bacterium]
MKRVAITGVGVITAAGADQETFWKNIAEGNPCFSPITRFDPSRTKTKLAGEIKDFDPEKYGIGKKEQRRMDLFCQYALAAATDALADAGTDFKDLDPFEVGVLVGSGIGGFSTCCAESEKFVEKGPGRVSVFFVPMMMGNIAAATVSMKYGFKGDNIDIVSACSSGAHAIGEAFRKIKDGYLTAAVCGGAEAALEELAIGGFENMGALSESTDPARASIPFDKERGGFVMGEGSGILVLEEYEHALARGAHIYAELAGYGATGDAYHMTSPDPEGDGAARAMKNALQEAGVAPEELTYINAHGTSTPINDLYETRAVKKAMGEENAHKVAISSTKGVTGHLLGAAGAVEAVVCALAVDKGEIPPTAGYRVPDEECDLDYVTEGPRRAPVLSALSNSLGFGGHNASLCFKKAK